MFSGGGGEEEEEASDVTAKKRAKVIAKNQAKRNQEQAWENARTAQKTQQAQNAIATNKNLAQAEAEMGKVKPVTPYAAASYIDKDEEKLLKGKESQRAWTAVNAQEQARQENLNDVYAARWEGVKDIELAKQKEMNSSLVCVVEPEKPKTLLDRIWDWGKNPNTPWSVAKEDETIKILKNADDIPLYLPVIRGITPYIDDFSGPLKTILMDKRTIRALGRFIGDVSVPWTLGIGLGLTILPNLWTNIRDKKPWSDTVADIIVDGIGFIFSEVAGLIAGGAIAFTGFGTWTTLAFKLGADLWFSYYWDGVADKNNWSERLSKWLGEYFQKETH